jgi:hypothetical protein
VKFNDIDEWHGCEVYGCNQRASQHEIVTRGSGGKREPINVIWLCDDHHVLGPDAFHRIGRESFMARFPQFRERIEAACAHYGREVHKGRH